MTTTTYPKSTKHKRGIVYVRVSSDEQVSGTSLDDQDRQSIQALEASGVEHVRSFRDEGASAKTADRDALIEAVAFCLDRKNRIEVFMVWKVDRFARRTEDHFAIRKTLRDAGVELRSATEPIGDDPSSKLFEVMVAGFAEFDNSVRRVRCVNGMRARIRSGIWPFKAPPGYRNRSLARRDIKKTEPDPVDPVAFALLQRLLKGFAKQAYSQKDILNELIKADFEVLTGTKPTLQFVDRLLGEMLPFYAGLLRDALGEEVEFHRGRHEPMINENEMRVIQRLRGGGAGVQVARNRGNPAFPLRRLLRCADCARPMTGSTSKGRKNRYAYYHCYNQTCPLRYKSLPRAEVEDCFKALMASLTPCDDFLTLLSESLQAFAGEEIDLRQARQDAQHVAIQTLEAKRSRVFEMAESGAYAPAQAKDRLDRIEEDLAMARIGLEETAARTLDPVRLLAQARPVISTVMAGWFDLEPTVRERFQKILFPEGISYVPKIGFGTAKVGRIFKLFRDFGDAKSCEVDRPRFYMNQVLEELTEIAELAPYIAFVDARP